MAYRGVKDDFRTLARGGAPSRVPFFAISQEFDARLFGVTYEEYLSSADTLFRAQAKAVRELDYDWALFQLHDGLEFEPLGLEVRGEGNILPGIFSHLPLTAEAIAGLRVPDFARVARVRVMLDAMRRTKAEFGEEVLVLGRIAAPFTAAVLCHGIEASMMALSDEAQTDLLRRTTEFFGRLEWAFAQEQAAWGADGLWYGDCLASSKLISLATHRRLALEANVELIGRIKSLGLSVFYEPADDHPEFMKVYAEEGIDAINVGIALDMASAKSAIGGRVGLLGNLDAIRFLQHGTPQTVTAEVERIVAIGRAGGGYAFCTDSVPREAKPENMRAMAAAVRRSGR
jgi:uroporphyrinogen decarboxylase